MGVDKRQDSVLRALGWVLISPWAIVVYLAVATLLSRRDPIAFAVTLAATASTIGLFVYQAWRYNYTYVPRAYAYFLRPVHVPRFERVRPPDETRLAVIVPVRDRNVQLEQFLQHMPRFLEQEGIFDYELWAIEQAPGKPFSRAVLSNVGFLEAVKSGTRNTFAFHDVDLLPIDRRYVTYTFVDHVRHLYGRPYALGSVFVTSERCYRAVNGYSNNYWGQGWQGLDLLERFRAKGIRVEQGFDRFTGGFRELDSFWASQRIRMRYAKAHRDTLLHNKRICAEQTAPDRILRQINSDGLNSCAYRVVSNHGSGKRRRILVSL